MVRLLVLLLAVSLCVPAQAPVPAVPPTPEIDRLNNLIEELTALKSHVAQTETKIEALLRALSEQRGALLHKPVYNALNVVETDGPAETKKPVVRCKALTSAGKRCTRAALDGSRYCRQHALAHKN